MVAVDLVVAAAGVAVAAAAADVVAAVDSEGGVGRLPVILFNGHVMHSLASLLYCSMVACLDTDVYTLVRCVVSLVIRLRVYK